MTPQAQSETPFKIHVDGNGPIHSAPQQIPADPTVVAKVDGDTAAGVWENDIFGCCFSCGDACLALLVPCVSACVAVDRIRGPAVSVLFGLLVFGVASDLLAYLFVTSKDDRATYYDYGLGIAQRYQYGYLIAFIACSAVYITIVALARNIVRVHYHIPGSFGTDCGAAFCCTCCTVTQMYTHTRLAKKKAKASAATLPAYNEA